MKKLLMVLTVGVVLALSVPVLGASAAKPTTTTGSTTTTTAPPSESTVWAVVNVDGTLARGSGAISSRQLGADGTYEVVFNRDVSQCAYVAAGGEATNFPPDDSITIGASTGESSPNAVSLIEYDAILARDSYSSGFHLIVTC